MLISMFDKKIITYLILTLFIFFSIHNDIISQESEIQEPADVSQEQEIEPSIEEDITTDEIDLDEFIKEIYSKEDFYSPTDKRDPFKPFVKVVDKEIEIKPEFNPLLPPIKRFALSQFKLVGVMWLESVPQAMLTDPERNTYILSVGDEIGNRQGSIVEIRENGIAVEEKYYLENAEGQRSVEIRKSILAFTEK